MRPGLLESVEGKGRVGDGSERESEEGHGVVVAGDAVGAEDAAAAASVNDGPFSVASDLDGDWLHGLAAWAGAVSRLLVEMS